MSIEEIDSDIMLFLMAVCHQPYSEIMKIPPSTVKGLYKSFTKVMEKLFGKGKKGKENVRKIASEIDVKAFEAMWSDKNE